MISLSFMSKRPIYAGLVALGLSAGAVQATDTQSSPYLFGTWGGERTQLQDEGVDFNFGYQNEAVHNYSGGDKELTRMTDQWKAGVTLDLDKLWGWNGTTFSLIYTDRNGRELGTDANLGTAQQVQELYGRGQTVWLTKMTLEKSFADGKFSLKAGRDSLGDDFGYAYCDFQNLSLCGSQSGNAYGSYWLNWPISVWMVRGKLETSAHTYLQLAVYQNNPTYTDNSWEIHSAWKPGNPSGSHGVVVPLEFGWTPKVNGFDGSYKFGAAYNSGGESNLYTDINGQPIAITGAPAQQSHGSYNGYVAIRQQVSGVNGGEGLDVDVRATMGDRATSSTDRQFTVDLEYKNPFHREGDSVGLGFAATHLNTLGGDYERQYNAYHPGDEVLVADSYEYVSELFYSWAPLPSLILQPNLQYVMHPGGSTQNSNAFVLGLKTVVNF